MNAGLTKIFDADAHLTITLDSTGRIVAFSGGFPERLGYSSEAIIGKRLEHYVAKGQRAWLRNALAGDYPNTRPDGVVPEMKGKDGTIHYFCVMGLEHMSDSNDSEGKRVLLRAVDVTDFIREREILSRNSDRFIELMLGTGEGIIYTDKYGFVEETNDAFTKITGVTGEEVAGKHMAALAKHFLGGVDVKKILKNATHLFNGESVDVIDIEFRGKVLEIQAPTLRKPGRGIISIIRDVTALRYEERALTLQKNLGIALSHVSGLNDALNIIIDNVLEFEAIDSAGIYIHDSYADTFDLVVSKGVTSRFMNDASSYGPDSQNYALLVKGDPIYCHGRDLAGIMKDTIEHEGLKAVAAIPILHDGNTTAAINVGSHTEDEFPAITRFLLGKVAEQIGGVVVRTRAEVMIRESEERFRQLADATMEGVLIIDNGIVIDCNMTFVEIYGGRREEIIGMQVTEMVGPEYREKIVDAMKSGTDSRYEIEGIIRNGSRINVEVRGKSIPYKGKSIRITALRDITEYRKTENKLLAALKKQEVLLQEVHHRVKNNLQVISSLLMLQADRITDEKHRDMFRESNSRIQSMAHVHDMLLQTEPVHSVDVKRYLSKISGTLKSAYISEADGVDICLDVDDIAIGLDYAIPCGLIVNELVTNSLKYAFSGRSDGVITISMKQWEEEMIELRIADNGCGIPDTVDWRTTDTLGLKIVRLLAESQIGGSIDLISDKGAEFVIRFAL